MIPYEKPLTPNELAVMESLWTHQDISYHEIIARSDENCVNLSSNSIHRILRNLLNRGFITVSSEDAIASTTLKKYSAAITREEYLTVVLQSNPIYDDYKLPGIFSCILKKKQEPDTIEKLYEIIRTEKESRY